MAQLYTVSFTTQKMIKKLDARGKVVSETALDTPIKMTALPYATAQSYSGCDNFMIENYVGDAHHPKSSAQRPGVGNGTKSARWDTSASREKPKSRAAAVPAQNTVQNAASTGNLAQAINGK